MYYLFLDFYQVFVFNRVGRLYKNVEDEEEVKYCNYLQKLFINRECKIWIIFFFLILIRFYIFLDVDFKFLLDIVVIVVVVVEIEVVVRRV